MPPKAKPLPRGSKRAALALTAPEAAGDAKRPASVPSDPAPSVVEVAQAAAELTSSVPSASAPSAVGVAQAAAEQTSSVPSASIV